MSEARKVYAVPILPPVLVGRAENLLEAELLVTNAGYRIMGEEDGGLDGLVDYEEGEGAVWRIAVWPEGVQP